MPSTTHEILHILRQQPAWGGGHVVVSGGTFFVSRSTFLLALTKSFCIQMLLFYGKVIHYSTNSHTIAIKLGIIATTSHLSTNTPSVVLISIKIIQGCPCRHGKHI